MEKIQIDNGIREYRINGDGVLRFNPADPNLYMRFLDAAEMLQKIEESMLGSAGENGERTVHLMAQADREMKQVLSRVFGEENDFHKLLGGVNLLAVANNGERVVTNLFAALQPILAQGAQRCAQDTAAVARQKAAARRQAQ